MKSAWPVPAGHQRTRQWLRRSDIVLPPSGLRRMKEFSPVITTSLGSTGAVMVVLLCARGPSAAPPESSAAARREQPTWRDCMADGGTLPAARSITSSGTDAGNAQTNPVEPSLGRQVERLAVLVAPRKVMRMLRSSDRPQV